jgi:hypothetical protein
VAAEIAYPVRFYLVLSAVVLGIGGLWYSSVPVQEPYFPPNAHCRQLLEEASRLADQADRAEQCKNDGDF